MFSVADLLAPISESEPSGINLEYDADFLALEDAATGKPEQQFGDTVIAAVAPDWSDVHARALALMARSRDLRLALFVFRSAAALYGMPGAAAGLQLIAGLLQAQWATVHPQLDASDDNDSTMRVNALLPLADPQAALADLRAASVSGRERGLKLRLLELATGKSQPFAGETLPVAAQVEAALLAAQQAGEPVLASLTDARDAMVAIDAVLRQHLDSTAAPELKTPLQLLRNVLELAQRACSGQASDPATGAAPLAGSNGAGNGQQGGGKPAGRADVLALLDQAIAWLEQHEPTNPAPLLIRRAQRLMNMSFLEIMQDMAPDAVSQVETIAGRMPD